MTPNAQAIMIIHGMRTMAHGQCRDHHTPQKVQWRSINCTYDPASNKYYWGLRGKAERLDYVQVISLINIELEDNAEARRSAPVELA